ncbi:MAG TPA: hypothetical protein PKC39_11705 [Ferruginibacter sp.]|nr:hypothetical protein [Ferruginibacter sp.]HMP21615.1 hypothetical protein [Ferruginibacter sp.]
MQKSHVFFEALFGRESTAAGNADFLKALVEEHPYFTPAQFYLLAGSESGAATDPQQQAKTALLFNNNYWLNYQLQHFGITEQAVPGTPGDNINAFTNTHNAVVEDVHSAENSLEPVATETIVDNHPEPVINIEAGVADPISTAGNEPEPEAQPDAGQQSIELTAATFPAISADDIAVVNDINIELPADDETSTGTEDSSLLEQLADEPETTEDAFIAEEPLLPVNDPAPEPAAAILNAEQQAAPAVQNEAGSDPLLFEPLHTTDYFASVGIKLSEEIKPADKLGQQLLSFTDWLKTMKKLQHSTTRLNTTAEAEMQVQQLAEKSNSNGDVITEAMADVLLQQGRRDKAIEMLEKLSLLNPAKSAYFATRIQKIKE